MPKPKTLEAIVEKLKKIGWSTDDYFDAVMALDKKAQQKALKAARAWNQKRENAVSKLKKVVEETREAFAADETHLLSHFDRISDELKSLRGAMRRPRMERVINALERDAPLGAHNLGQLAASLSDEGISFREQAMLLANKLPGKSHALRAQKSVEELLSDLKTAAWRSRDKISDEDNMKLVVETFPTLFPKGSW